MTLQMRFFSKKNKIKKFRSNVQKGRRRCIFIMIEKSWGSDRKEKNFNGKVWLRMHVSIA